MKKVSADLKVALGDKIRNLRRIKGLTQEELGEKAGLSYKYI
jgi:transcriptional regulator with XRE-family HTH domain